MAITDEQVKQVKDQLLTQLDSFPEEKRGQIKEQIGSMTNEQVEEFVKQNQLAHMPGGECIFCSIAQGKTPSTKIAEDENNIAILELNPLARGHTLIVPKNHESKPSPEFAKQIETLLQQNLNPKPSRIETQESTVMEHNLLSLLPFYEGEQITERKQATPEELKAIHEQLTPQPESIQTPPAKEEIQEPAQPKEPEELFQAKPRIP